MDAFLISTVVVALAEIGDKTQLLSLALACRFRQPWSIGAGILVATLANHAAAGALGTLIAGFLGPEGLRWIAGLGFLAMAGWALIPDRLDDEEAERGIGLGAFVTTLVCFFIVEIGDKTQIATIALAARFDSLLAVVVGTTLGMMAANVPAILLGHRFAGRIRLDRVRWAAAALFAVLGIATLLRAFG